MMIQKELTNLLRYTHNQAVKDIAKNALNFIKKSDAPTSDNQ